MVQPGHGSLIWQVHLVATKRHWRDWLVVKILMVRIRIRIIGNKIRIRIIGIKIRIRIRIRVRIRIRRLMRI